MWARRLIAAGLVALACAAVVGTALAAPASGGRHLPYFSLLNERVAVKKLPFEARFLLEGPGAAGGFGLLPQPSGGSIWFGEVEREGATIMAVGQGHSICVFEQPDGERGGGGDVCTTIASARELGLFRVGSCGKGPARHFRIGGLVPDGVAGLEIEKSDGTIGRTVPVIENTFAFTVGRGDITLHAVGDAVAVGLERTLPLAHVGSIGGNRGGCSFYTFAEAKGGG